MDNINTVISELQEAEAGSGGVDPRTLVSLAQQVRKLLRICDDFESKISSLENEIRQLKVR